MSWKDTITTEESPKSQPAKKSWRDTITEEQVTQPSEPSQVEALLRGLAQGITLESADELAGAVASPIGAAKAAANILGADFQGSDLEEYKKERDLSRQAYKAAEEAHPVTYTAAEIGGGFAVPGLGTMKGIGAGAKGLGKVATRAIEGAALGAAGGIGSTELEGTEVLGEAGKGATLGGVISPVAGGLLDKIVPALKWGAGKIADEDVLANAYAKAKAGQSLAEKGAIYDTNKQLLDFIRKDLAPVVDTKTKQVVSSAYDDALAAARASGKTVSIEDLMSNVQRIAQNERMGEQDTKKVMDLLNRFGESGPVATRTIPTKPNFVNPEEQYIQNQMDALKRTQDVKEIKSQLARAGEPSLGGQQPGLFKAEGPAFGSDILAAKSQSASPTIVAQKPYTPKGEKSSIDYIFEDKFNKPNLGIDDLTDLKRRLEVLAKSSNPDEADMAAKMAQLVKNKSRELAGTDNYKMADELRKLQSEIESKFGNIADNPIFTEDRMAMDRAAKSLGMAARSVGKNRPEGAILQQEGFEALGKILPEEASRLQKELGEKALNVETATVLGQSINPFNPKGIFSLEPSMAQAADWAGKGVKKIHDWSDNDLAQAVQYLYTSGKNTYAKMLERAAMAPGEKKRALLFSLTQNPDFRNALPGSEE